MALKTLTNKHGHTFKMGRKRSTTAPRLRLKHYLKLDGPPPSSVNYAPLAERALGEIYGNDKYGDCVIAGVMHVEGVVSSNAGSPVLYTLGNVVNAYEWCGYNPADPSTDQGCMVQTVLQNWVSLGIPGGGSKATAFLAVDPTNKTEIQTALWLFENLIFGVELPDAWVSPMPSGSGFTWDVAGSPDPNNGHCFAGFGYASNGVNIATWGMQGVITYAAIAEYCSSAVSGELYVMLTQDLLDKVSQVAPDGLDWAGLVADFDAMGGSVPTPAPPAPTPVPPIPPSPPKPVPPTPPPSPGTVPLPVGAYGIVVAAHGHHVQHVVNLPSNAIGIAVH